ncbi:hypothetical protein [Paenisporosarcina sp. TG20]|uniref:hypothetical protein n=1 Tax=Paenisporosarcina sp. TG20 TaxID=1211706 RepID=UPI0002D31577|nr:hypothetical protein [Paenisporosarcina sp. TG20]
MEILNIIIGIGILFIGSLLFNTTIYNEPFNNILIKIIGIIVLGLGFFYLNRIVKFGKKKV